MLRAILSQYRAAFRGLSREVWILSAVLLINRTGTMVVPFLTLYLTKRHGYGIAEAGGFLALHGLGGFAGIFLGGKLTDRIGFMPVMQASLVASGLALFALGAVEGAWPFGAMLLLFGFFAESFRPASGAAIAAYSTEEGRPRAYGLQRLAVNLGWTAGPVIGGLLASVDYSWLFLVDGGTCLLSALPLTLALRGAPVRAPSVDKERRAEADGRAASPWADRPFVLFLGLLFFQGIVFFQFQSTLPVFLAQERAFSEKMIGIVVASNTIVIVLFEMILIRAVDRISPLKVVAVSSLFIGVGYGMTSFVHSLPFIILSVVVWTVGEMLTAPMTITWTSRRAGDGNRGRYMGAYGMCYSACAVVAPLAGTWVYQRAGSTTLWTACFVVGVLDAAGLWWMARRLR